MEEWYVMNPQPTMNSGFEKDEWDDYVFDAFDEALTETQLGDTVKFCRGQYDEETGNFEVEFETQAAVQDKSPDAYTRGWQRQILTRISDNIDDYKYIKYKDKEDAKEQIYLIVTMPSTNKIYTKAVIHECNYILKWQDEETGLIYTYPTYTADATQYNTGVESANGVVQTGYVQLMSWISLDDVTVELQRDKRMFIDYSKKHPETFIITSMSKVPYSYNEMRMMRITFTECEMNPKTDRPDLMLCDYIEPKIQPTQDIVLSYAGEAEIRIGGKKTIKSSIQANFEIVVADMWRDKVSVIQTSDTSCKVTAELDYSMIGANIKVKAISGGLIGELNLKVKGVV